MSSITGGRRVIVIVVPTPAPRPSTGITARISVLADRRWRESLRAIGGSTMTGPLPFVLGRRSPGPHIVFVARVVVVSSPRFRTTGCFPRAVMSRMTRSSGRWSTSVVVITVIRARRVSRRSSVSRRRCIVRRIQRTHCRVVYRTVWLQGDVFNLMAVRRLGKQCRSLCECGLGELYAAFELGPSSRAARETSL